MLGNRGKSVASPVGEIGAGAEFYDYDDKYKNGVAQLFIPARLPEDVAEEVRKTAVRAYNLLGCDGLSDVYKRQLQLRRSESNYSFPAESAASCFLRQPNTS